MEIYAAMVREKFSLNGCISQASLEKQNQESECILKMNLSVRITRYLLASPTVTAITLERPRIL